MWIGGDYNLPDIDWKMNMITGYQYPKIMSETFLGIINDLNLEQLIDFPTRKGNFLDLILTNNPSLVTCIDDLPGISDHTSIASIDILCHPCRQKPVSCTIHLWAKANLDLVKQTLNDKIISFCEKFQEHSVENQWLEFKTIVKYTMDGIPSKKISPRFNQPWFTRECNKLSKRKKRLYKSAIRTNMNTDRERFKAAFKKCKNECKAAHDN